MSKLYQCPYSKATTCTHEIPCVNCDTFYKSETESLKIVVETPKKVEVKDG